MDNINQTHYFKRRQENDWHYYKLLDGRKPVAYELVSLLNEIPSVHFVELDLDVLSSKTQYYALWEVGTVIGVEEYQEAYNRATQGDFDIYL